MVRLGAAAWHSLYVLAETSCTHSHRDHAILYSAWALALLPAPALFATPPPVGRQGELEEEVERLEAEGAAGSPERDDGAGEQLDELRQRLSTAQEVHADLLKRRDAKKKEQRARLSGKDKDKMEE